MTVVYLDLADFVAIAAEVTGLDESTIISAANLNLADSALNAPAASFGGEEFYPDFVDKCDVLAVRLAKNHPLPDGNKRVCWVALRLFIELNGWDWTVRPSIDEAERTVLAVASGALGEDALADWLRSRIAVVEGEAER